MRTHAEVTRDKMGGVATLLAVVKADCPTCQLVGPVLAGLDVEVVSEDNDAGLERSWRLGIDTVPTLLRVDDAGVEVERIVGWSREQWESFTHVSPLGDDLPPHRPGCASLTQDPDLVDSLAVRFGGSLLRSRRVELAELEDEHEAMFERGWTDGLPVVPPTEARVMRMLAGTTRAPDEIVAIVPPDLVECTVEKVAVNAVMAGCKPEYLPVVLAALEGACTDTFNIHGLLATTWFSGPLLIVDGPITARIGMNSGVNAMGQGNRANASIGRALQLTIRNVGGGKPGGVDRATLGWPGKYTFCFAEATATNPWESLSESRGVKGDAVTLFAAGGVQGVVDQLSRTPESLVRSFAACLRVVAHPKLMVAFDAVLVVSPEHARVFRDGGWDRARVHAELDALLQVDGADAVQGAHGISEGIPKRLEGVTLPKFRPGGLLLAHAGGGAGLFSAIICGWASGDVGSSPVTVQVTP
ncbi:MAG: hypothetical protein QOI47_124 [Actinomycetota bacterium]|nr:hypothetical protein [Actinomycetota bacterium]